MLLNDEPFLQFKSNQNATSPPTSKEKSRAKNVFAKAIRAAKVHLCEKKLGEGVSDTQSRVN